MKMKDKVVIVTGAANGIGKEIALTFAKEGANLCMVDIDENNLKLAADEIEQTGSRTWASKVDVSQGKEVHGFVETVIEKFNTVDILINCAAVVLYENFLDFKVTEWQKTLDVNLSGYFLLSQAVARKMVENRVGGRIINIASVGADFGHRRSAAYAASKAGVVALTKVMALELGEHGINVTAISPGPIATQQLKDLLSEEEMEQRTRITALHRFGTTSEIARAALFLASEDAGYITGSVLRVDGGLSWTRT